MNIRRHPLLREVVDLLRDNNADDINYEIGGRHIRVRFTVKGRKVTSTVPISPSDHRSRMNCLSQHRRLIRQAQV